MRSVEPSPVLKPNHIPAAAPFGICQLQKPKDRPTKGSIPIPHKPFFEIIWVISGRGRCRIDLGDFGFEQSHVFCVRPGQLYRLQAPAPLEGMVISVSGAFLDKVGHDFDPACRAALYQLLAREEGIPVKREMLEEMKEVAGKMRQEFDHGYPFRAEMLKRYLKIFLIYLARQQEEGPLPAVPARKAELVRNFMGLLEKDFKREKMVAGYARRLSVTPNYLNEIIKKSTGYPAGHHIRQRVVQEARRLCLYSDMCMKEIAWHLGFSDIAHFSKFFKTVTGIRFSDFKKKRVLS